uniref:RRM domain-containing protein n=1 Tax=Parascaris univalens TaxID=6257 RepID=A0A915AFC4_PARUN
MVDVRIVVLAHHHLVDRHHNTTNHHEEAEATADKRAAPISIFVQWSQLFLCFLIY